MLEEDHVLMQFKRNTGNVSCLRSPLFMKLDDRKLEVQSTSGNFILSFDQMIVCTIIDRLSITNCKCGKNTKKTRFLYFPSYKASLHFQMTSKSLSGTKACKESAVKAPSKSGVSPDQA